MSTFPAEQLMNLILKHYTKAFADGKPVQVIPKNLMNLKKSLPGSFALLPLLLFLLLVPAARVHYNMTSKQMVGGGSKTTKNL